MSNMQLVTRSGHARGGYRIGVHLLVASDILEFVENEQVTRGQVIYDGIRYLVITADRRLFPLSELMWARYVGHGLP